MGFGPFSALSTDRRKPRTGLGGGALSPPSAPPAAPPAPPTPQLTPPPSSSVPAPASSPSPLPSPAASSTPAASTPMSPATPPPAPPSRSVAGPSPSSTPEPNVASPSSGMSDVDRFYAEQLPSARSYDPNATASQPEGGTFIGTMLSPGFDWMSGRTFDVPEGWRLKRSKSGGYAYLQHGGSGETMQVPMTMGTNGFLVPDLPGYRWGDSGGGGGRPSPGGGGGGGMASQPTPGYSGPPIGLGGGGALYAPQGGQTSGGMVSTAVMPYEGRAESPGPPTGVTKPLPLAGSGAPRPASVEPRAFSNLNTEGRKTTRSVQAFGPFARGGGARGGRV